jgi:hypothetical protein
MIEFRTEHAEVHAVVPLQTPRPWPGFGHWAHSKTAAPFGPTLVSVTWTSTPSPKESPQRVEVLRGERRSKLVRYLVVQSLGGVSTIR